MVQKCIIYDKAKKYFIYPFEILKNAFRHFSVCILLENQEENTLINVRALGDSHQKAVSTWIRNFAPVI